LLAVGSPETVVTPINLRSAFRIEATLIDTPIGKQICPLHSSNS
jgi:hypothetical protein